jgi:hypothetical protein
MTGERLLAIARNWFSADIVTSVFEPLIADWDTEHRALSGVARLHSLVRIWCCFAATAAQMLPWQLKHRLPERVTLGTWVAAEGFALVGIGALLYLSLGATRTGTRHLFPAALAVALPLAHLPAAVIASRFGTALEARTMMLRLTLLSMLTLTPLLAWWMPHSNQAWRVAQRPHEFVMRGNREVLLTELFRSQSPSDVFLERGKTWDAVRRDIVLERTSILFMPLTMTAAGLAVARLTRRRWPLIAVAAWAIGGWTWLTLIDISPWSMHAVLLAATFALHRHDRRSTAPAR